MLKGGVSVSRQASTNCQRRSMVVASITSSSETCVYAWSSIARASWAGGTGGWPCGQGTSRFCLHICGVKPTVFGKSRFNEQICGGETHHALNTCEAIPSYLRA